MNTKMLFDAIHGYTNDPRPIILEVRTREGVFSKVLQGVGESKDAIRLSAGDLPDALDAPRGSDRVRVTPMPSSPYVGPNGEFYPMG